jgi:hypothetical protein
MAEILDEIKEPELQLEEGESAGNIVEDNHEEAHDNIADEGEFAPDVSTIPVDPDSESDLPEKYRGKSAAEVVEMHRELERRMSDQGNELSNLRSTLDAMAFNQSKAHEPEPEPITEADFFSDPTNTVNRAIESHPALRQAQDMAQKMAYAQGLATLQQRHPDVKEVVGSEKFKEWVKGSSARLARYQRADQMGDVEEADDLISTFKQLNKVEATTREVSKKAQKQAVRSASTGAVRGNSDVQGSRRVYRRADIRELMRTNPQRYEDLQDEIMRAYAEGRVRD